MIAQLVRDAAWKIVARQKSTRHTHTDRASSLPLSEGESPVASVATSVRDPKPEFSPLPSSPAHSFDVSLLQAASPLRVPSSVTGEGAPPSPGIDVQHPESFNLRQRILSVWRSKVWTPGNKAFVQRLSWYGVYGLAGWFAVVTVLIFAYRFFDPPASNLMLYNYLRGNTVHHTWVPLEKISPAVIKAVVVAEDAQFCRHWGIDFAAIQYAIEHAKGGTPRGASTISMQTAKNMFLWQSKSYIRKALEVPVTFMMELIWPKKRILEVYLNIAEWGPGIFGIGAAAKRHFKTTPARLNASAAARLAASLPNPKVRRAGRPGPKTQRKANVIRGRARHSGYYTGCVLG